ncbi:hypothetical protein CLV31_101137 [Algoriphagus aquaeductus]|uniref:PKD domain-containing protein n=1 Tax=Algoriphagus aquaeductus TaxID=475299 RepID=A0A326RXJ7_9BACT|nr:hypothetical protein [Algoriphagus aquaeductus]PZV87265.1 hypothetical protein CLV31_101137 [Algoriphagus aquaeductus]
MKTLFRILISLSLFLTLETSFAQNPILDTPIDSMFLHPYIDIDEWRNEPVRHRYVHGGFEGTETRFSFYFPPKEQYEGRFFQYITPFPDNENLAQGAQGEEDVIGFSISSGAYFVETNGGGKTDFANPQANDASIGAYRANAASAQFSRKVAQEFYGGDRPFGYAFGGSGGAYRTVGGIENTKNVWDGVVPFVMGSPMAIPNSFTIRMHAMRILKDKFPQIVASLEPGGSGDPYLGLNEEEKAALLEATRMGFPPQSWYGYKEMGIHGFLVLYQGVVMADKGYFENDFWNTPGYLGANPPESLLKARIQEKTKVKASINLDDAIATGIKEPISEADRGSADLAWKSMGGEEGGMPVAFELEDSMPNVGFLGGDLIVQSGEAEGVVLQITDVIGNKVVLGPTNSPETLFKIKAGDQVQVDNSNFLAVQTYHRHQVPGPEYTAWDQFRDAEGNPIYPQRPYLIGPFFTMGAAGSLPTGKFEGKMILLGSLWDREAYPWQQAWYRDRVFEHLGEKANDHFRLWYTDHAIHGDASGQLDDNTRVVSYLGVLQQALRDLSQWVEKGTEPASSTSYKIVDGGQVKVPEHANERAGIQATVHATVNGTDHTTIKKGESLSFHAKVEIPKNTGKLVYAAWDFDGSGEFKNLIDLGNAVISNNGSQVEFDLDYVFDNSGVYFASLKIATQREGDSSTPFARIQNIDRVKVSVKD